MKKKYFLIIINLILVLIAVTNCSTVKEGKAFVTINLHHKSNDTAGYNNSYIDRFLRFFAVEARAQAAPANITSLTLKISASDMDSIVKSYSKDTASISIEVPAGKGRVFELTAVTSSFNYAGTATADLTAGKDVTLSITMAGQFANVTINTTFPIGTPAGNIVGTYTVNVIRGGSTISATTFTPGTMVQLAAGANTDFEIFANTTSATFRGSATGQNIAAGSDLILPVSLTLYETKIVVPDFLNNRVVQVDDVTGTGSIPKYNTDFGLPALSPYDIDFDPQGRIYIANYNISVDGGIIRINNISDSSPVQAGGTGFTNLISVAVDRNSSLLYYSTDTQLYQNNLSNTAETLLSTICFDQISGLTIDDTAMLYITCNTSGASPVYEILKYNTYPSFSFNNRYTISTGSPNGTPMDVTYKSPYLYVTNYQSANIGNQIIQFDTNLIKTGGYGNIFSEQLSIQ